MVGIVAVTKFCEANSSPFKVYIDYMDRDNAARTKAAERYDLFRRQDFGEYQEYMDNDKKQNFHHADLTESNLFSRHTNNLLKEEKAEMKTLFSKAEENGSNMWQTVISFDNDYLRKHKLLDEGGILNEDLLKNATRKAVDLMLKNEHLENAEWTAAIHYNTDNIHIHIATVEPTPMREQRKYREYKRDPLGEFELRYNPATKKKERIPIYDENGKPKFYYAYKGTFKQSSMETLKREMVAEIEQDKEALIEINQLIRGMVDAKREHSFQDEKSYQKEFLQIYEELKGSGIPRQNWNYHQNQIAFVIPKVDELAKKFIEEEKGEEYQALLGKLEEKEKAYQESYGGTNHYLENKLYGKDGLYARMGNAILKEVRFYDQLQEKQKPLTENKEKNKSFASVYVNGDLRRAMYFLKRSLNNNFEKWKNMQEFEKLQQEISERESGIEL